MTYRAIPPYRSGAFVAETLTREAPQCPTQHMASIESFVLAQPDQGICTTSIRCFIVLKQNIIVRVAKVSYAYTVTGSCSFEELNQPVPVTNYFLRRRKQTANPTYHGRIRYLPRLLWAEAARWTPFFIGASLMHMFWLFHDSCRDTVPWQFSWQSHEVQDRVHPCFYSTLCSWVRSIGWYIHLLI